MAAKRSIQGGSNEIEDDEVNIASNSLNLPCGNPSLAEDVGGLALLKSGMELIVAANDMWEDRACFTVCRREVFDKCQHWGYQYGFYGNRDARYIYAKCFNESNICYWNCKYPEQFPTGSKWWTP